ncbi:hypothetical protein PFISCL1PPCAC_8557, partial [Pristionchus fissidentatus]
AGTTVQWVAMRLELVNFTVREEAMERHSHLSPKQQHAVFLAWVGEQDFVEAPYLLECYRTKPELCLEEEERIIEVYTLSWALGVMRSN